MSFDQSFLAPEAHRYATGLLDPPFPVMERVEEEAQKEGQPVVGRMTGSLLRALVAATGGQRVLEVGCNLGYSALWMAAGLARDGRLDTIEIEEELARRARGHFRDAGVADRLEVHVGAALDVLPRLIAPYDLVFLDAVKDEYPKYLDHALRLVRPGGIIAADNMFWLGHAWDETAQDDQTLGVREYTRRTTTDPRLATTLVPSEDGLMMSVLKG